MGELVDFFEISFEAGYSLFADEFEEIAVVFVIFTSKATLEVGETINLKRFLEETDHVRDWVKSARKDDIMVAFDVDEDESSRKDKVNYLRNKMKPLLY